MRELHLLICANLKCKNHALPRQHTVVQLLVGRGTLLYANINRFSHRWIASPFLREKPRFLLITSAVGNVYYPPKRLFFFSISDKRPHLRGYISESRQVASLFMITVTRERPVRFYCSFEYYFSRRKRNIMIGAAL